MTLKRIRYCDQCNDEIPTEADFLGTEGIYIDGKGREEGTDIVKDEDFCSVECLGAYIKIKMQQDKEAT